MPTTGGGGATNIATGQILDDTIADVDINSAAAISFSKLAGTAMSGANSNITSLSGLTTPLSQAQGGTGQAEFTKVISLSSADILGLGPTPLIVVAGVANRVLVPLCVVFKFTYNSVAYLNGAQVVLEEETSGVDLINCASTTLMRGTANGIECNWPTVGLKARVAGKGLALSCNGSDFDTGNSTAEISITYISVAA